MAVAGPGASIVGISAGRIVVNTTINAADLITEYSAGAKIYLERDTTSAFGSPTVVTSTALVSGTEQYEFSDTSGTSSSWYRVRVGNSGGTAYTAYSDGVQALQALAYASIDDVVGSGSFGTDTSRYPWISDRLIMAKDLIDERCGRSFSRNPQISGDGTFILPVRRQGKRLLSSAMGYGVDIVSITTLELIDFDGGTYRTIAAGSTGYYLLDGFGPGTWPYENIELSRYASTFVNFQVANTSVRLTGVMGFSVVPSLVRAASIDMVREWYRQGPQGGVPSGASQYSTPSFANGEPHTFRQLTAPGSPYVKHSWA